MIEKIIIAAVAKNDAIGNNGELPWKGNYPEDLNHFRRTTLNHPVIMGSNTFRSIMIGIKKPLPKRTNIILSRRGIDVPEGVIVVPSIEESIWYCEQNGFPRAYIIGGATVYEQTIKRIADKMIITHIDIEYEGDTFFPEIDGRVWKEVDRRVSKELAWVTYERR